MVRTVRRLIGWIVRWSIWGVLISAGIVAFRHMLDTPQQLNSLLPGEALLYRWKRQQVFYKVLGRAEAPPLVLLHAPAIGASAYEMRSILEPLAQAYRVYAPDLPGFGLSDRPNIDYSAELYAAFLRDFLSDVVRRPATIVASGESCNYAIAAAASPDTAELCARLVLISPFALQGYSPQRANWLPLAKILAAAPVKALLYPLLSTRAAFALMQNRQHPLVHDTNFDYFYAATHQLGGQHAPIALLAGKLAQDSSKQFENLRQPTLIIWGVKALSNARSLASPGNGSHMHGQAQIELMPDVGRYAHEERPEAVVSLILQWAEQGRTPEEAPVETRQVEAKEEAKPAERASVEAKAEVESTEQAEAKQVETREETKPVEEVQVEAKAEAESAPTEEVKPADKHIRAQVVEVLEAYCVRCKKKTKVLNAHQITMKNGRPAVRGTCAVCGGTIQRIGRLGQTG